MLTINRFSRLIDVNAAPLALGNPSTELTHSLHSDILTKELPVTP